ncbi:hypothetical protein IAT38_007195 [Cryptococcus sp. DSM 104549]
MAKPPDEPDSHHHGPTLPKAVTPTTPPSPTHPSPPRQDSTSSITTVSSQSSSQSSSTTSSGSGPALATPELPHSDTLSSSPPHTHTFPSPHSSPEGSTSSTAHSKGESTPRAEIAPPVWPLSAATPRKSTPAATSTAASAAVFDEPLMMGGGGGSAQARADDAPETSLSRASSLQRASSWRKKHASLDTPPTAPHHHAPFPDFTSFTEIPPLAQPPKSKFAQGSESAQAGQQKSTTPPPLPPTTAVYPRDPRRASADARFATAGAPPTHPAVPSGPSRWTRSRSPATGCQISAPKPPPAGYPLAAFYPGGNTGTSADASGIRRNSSSSGLGIGFGLQPPASSAASTASSSSSGGASAHSGHSAQSMQSGASSTRSSTSTGPRSPASTSAPPPPRWARPPAITDSYSGRAHSFKSASSAGGAPDVNFDDFDPELFEGQEDEWIEVIKGAEGRIAIKSTAVMYDIMVWLPGFSIDNITIATRGTRTIHIVADQWDEGDHAQWDIKLGEDANLKSVNAKFTGKELRVTVAREQSEYQRSRKLRAAAAESRSAQAGSVGGVSRAGGFGGVGGGVSRAGGITSGLGGMGGVSGPSITATTKSSPLERATAGAPAPDPTASATSASAAAATAPSPYQRDNRI